jgi:Xaa-Pro aminopeptidase
MPEFEFIKVSDGFLDRVGEWLTPQEADELPFTEEEYAERLSRLRERMADARVDLLLLTAPESICYLHNFRLRWYNAHATTRWSDMSVTAAHVDHDRLYHFDALGHRPLVEAISIAHEKRCFRESDWYGRQGTREEKLAVLLAELKTAGWLRRGSAVGMEMYSHVPSPAVHSVFVEGLKREGCEVVDGTRLLRSVRRVKSAREIGYIEAACRIADVGHRALKEALRPGVTELELYGEATRAMSAAGGEPSAIVGNVCTGPHQASHALMTSRRVVRNQHLFFDPCGVVHGYHANVCRGYWVGDEPPEFMVQNYKLAAGGFDVLSKVAKAGTPIKEVNRALREHYRGAQNQSSISYAMGYELGLAFPPDWVGEFQFGIEEEDPEGVFLENEVTNFESIIDCALIDTFVYERDGARRLSGIEPELIRVEA